MTTHLSDEQLNEILDGRLHAPHLDSCTECQTRLAGLRAVFTSLQSLPEKELPRDLSVYILARLPQQKAGPAWGWALALQSAFALGIFIWVASLFQVPPELAAYQLPSLESVIISLTASVSGLQFSLPSLPASASSLQLSTVNLSLLLLSAAALWVVGNNILLRAPLRGHQQ